MLKRAFALAILATAPLAAQNTNTTNARVLWEQAHKNVADAAKDVPEKLYAYRPTPAVRTFGELVAHVAGPERMFCGMTLGEKQAEDAIEKTVKTKAALVAALAESKTYCARAYATNDAAN